MIAENAAKRKPKGAVGNRQSGETHRANSDPRLPIADCPSHHFPNTATICPRFGPIGPALSSHCLQ